MCRANFGAKLTEELENTAPEGPANLAQRFSVCVRTHLFFTKK